MLVFKKRKNSVGGFNYEARGDFRKHVNFIRITKTAKVWSMLVFTDESYEGELYGTYPTSKDAIFYAELDFAD